MFLITSKAKLLFLCLLTTQVSYYTVKFSISYVVTRIFSKNVTFYPLFLLVFIMQNFNKFIIFFRVSTFLLLKKSFLCLQGHNDILQNFIVNVIYTFYIEVFNPWPLYMVWGQDSNLIHYPSIIEDWCLVFPYST